MQCRKSKAWEVDLISVDVSNIDKVGFFCYMSKRKSEGYINRRNWLLHRFNEGLRIKMLDLPERGFIEYMPGESCWRAVRADGYFVIHCLWVVGKSRDKGLGLALLNSCVDDARSQGRSGVVMLASSRVWLAGPDLFLKAGFEAVSSPNHTAPFTLLVKRFGLAPLPSLAGDWDRKAEVLGPGLTVVRSSQCPYIPDATRAALQAAETAGISASIVELKNRNDVMDKSPSPYGVFSLVLDGKLVSYHYMVEKDLVPLLQNR